MTERADDSHRPLAVPTLTDIVQTQPAADGADADAAHGTQPPADASLPVAAPAGIAEGMPAGDIAAADMPVPLAQIPTLMPEPQAEAGLRTSRYIERALHAVGGGAAQPPQPEPPPASADSSAPNAPAWLGVFDDLQPLRQPDAQGLQGDVAPPGGAVPALVMQAPPPRDAASELAERVAWEMLQLGQAVPAQPPAVAAPPDTVEPLLAEDVQAEGFCAVAARAAQADAWPDTAALRELLPGDFEEQLVHRVMQRVDAVLTDRVGEVIAAVIERQTRSLLPSIREELEFAIRKSVYEAMADELAGIQASGLAGKPQ
ncbi:hypothetical protein [Vandammella animalimorsus]|uniref:hypothetical protein n=1 Tax=Vandammella animalimorsus TaxID=2029117 RepID=UPI001EEDF9C9|nr:hypothetical protein [Vandammella animalimorsus]